MAQIRGEGNGMGRTAEIVICGTGSFAARILFDLAATTPLPLSVAIAGRNAERLMWMRTGAAARADMFGTELHVTDHHLDALTMESVAGVLGELQPRVIVNAASVQGGRGAAMQSDGWTRLVQRAGLGVSAVLQARISLDVSKAAAAAAPNAFVVNCCYPDVVNPMIAAAGLPVASGIGNVAILAHAFAGALGRGHERIQLVASHAALSAFRRPAAERSGKAPLRMWLGGRELGDVFERFASVKLAPEPVIDVSGASGVPLFRAMVEGTPWTGHAPGPNGLPGGYPVRLDAGVLRLDLPPGVSESEAIAWNTACERENGVLVGADGFVRYTGRVEEALRDVSPAVAAGFAMSEFDAAFEALWQLRTRLRDGGSRSPKV
jgi:hypothetical protein